MIRRARRLLAPAFFLVVLAVATVASADPQYPALTGRVVDEAGIISQPVRDRLELALQAYETKSGNQLVVVTLKSLQDYPIEEFGVGLGRAWGIGREGKNNGALLIVAPNEREIRIEAGYGLKGELTDALSHDIIQNRILPAFRNEQYDAGIEAGVAGIMAVLGETYEPMNQVAPQPQSRDEGPWPVFFFIALFVVVMLLRNHFNGRRGGGMGPWIAGGLGGGFGGGGRGGFRGGGFRGGGGFLRRRRGFGPLVSAGFLTEPERRAIEAAIRAAEARTSGEFVAIVARQSDDYLLLPILYAAAAALTVPPLVWVAALVPALPWAYGIQAAVFAIVALALSWSPLTMLVVPRSIKQASAARLAREQFFARGLHETRGRTGVLLFVSVAEHYVEILADRGIDEKAPAGLWEGVIAEFTRRVKDGRTADGFLAAVQTCGALLAEHFPRAADDRDELPDVLIEV